jgi:hypothetical protein
VNILEFYITDGCDLYIRPRDAIQTKVRMEWTMDEFFADGGTTSFVDRITSSLGIHASEVKIVSVYEGSLVVNYEIELEESEDEDAPTLEDIKETQAANIDSGDLDFGAPVLELEVEIVVDNSTDFIEPMEKVYGL